MSDNVVGITLTATDKASPVVNQLGAAVTKATGEMATKGSANTENLAAAVVKKTQTMAEKGGGAARQLEESVTKSTQGMADKGAAAAQKLAESVEKSTRGMASRVKNPISSLGDMFISGLGGAISKVGGFLTDLKTLATGALTAWGINALAGEFIGIGASMEKMRLTLDTITKGGGDVWFEKLNAWALKMPVDTQKAIQSFTMMRAMGLKPTIDQMTTLVDTTSALGGGAEVMNGISRALGQISAKGKVSAEELMQLSEHGVPAMEILKEKLHLTGAQVANIGTMAISADVGVKALLDGMAERFGGQSSKIQGTWGGMMESLKGYWTEFTRLVMSSGVMSWLEDKIGGVVAQLDQMLAAGELQSWAAKTGATVTGALDKIYKTGQQVLAWWQEHSAAVKDNIKLAGDIAMQLGGVYLAAKALSSGAQLATWGKTTYEAMTLAIGGVKGLQAAMAGMAPTLALYAGYKLGGWVQKLLGIDEASAVKAQEAAQKIAQTVTAELVAKQAMVQQTAQTELNAMRATLLEDRDTLQARADQYKAYIDTVQGLVKKAAEEEKKLIKEVNDLYKQKLELLASTEDKIRKLSEIGMTDPQKYASQSGALGTEYNRAMQLAGQDQIKALEKYKADLASFAETWSQGVNDTTGAVVVSGQEVIDWAVANLQSVGDQQQQTLAALTQAKNEQLTANQEWIAALQASAQQAEVELATLNEALAAIDQTIRDMQKEITVKSRDEASATLAAIKAKVDALHDKDITITTHQITMYSASDGPASAKASSADPSSSFFPTAYLDSYAVGTNYVPQTGLYKLHQGEIVVPAAEAELVRSGQMLTAARDVSNGAYARDYGANDYSANVSDEPEARSSYIVTNDYGAKANTQSSRQETTIAPSSSTSIRRGGDTNNSLTKRLGDIVFNFTFSGGAAPNPKAKEDAKRMVREVIVPELRLLGLVHA